MRDGLLVGLFIGPACVLLGSAADRPLGERPRTDRLAKPLRVEVDGKPIMSDDGVLFPFVGDLDGDGRPDLLLGTRDKGRLLVYRNVGSNTHPRLNGPQWFDERVPTGRIPAG
jgi:hypothetical protein